MKPFWDDVMEELEVTAVRTDDWVVIMVAESDWGAEN